MIKQALVPPDLNRCQATMMSGSFMTLGPRHRIQCDAVPSWIAIERGLGEDGQIGSMSLCNDCAKTCLKKFGKDRIKLRSIA
jgi:hypothetical protein